MGRAGPRASGWVTYSGSRTAVRVRRLPRALGPPVTDPRPSPPGAAGEARADADDRATWSSRGGSSPLGPVGWPAHHEPRTASSPEPRQRMLGWPSDGDHARADAPAPDGPARAAPVEMPDPQATRVDAAPPAPDHPVQTAGVPGDRGDALDDRQRPDGPADDQHDVHAAPADEPPSAVPVVGPLISSLRHPVLAVFPVVALLALGVGAALGTPAVHTAEAQVLVGRVDVESTAVPGFVSANENLAGLYARIADTSVIAAPVGEELGLSSGAVLSQVTASPIPETSIVRIEASSENSLDAVVLAAEVAQELITYVEGNSVRPAGVEASLEAFETASAELLDAQDDLAAAQAALDQATGPSAAALSQDVVRAQAVVNTRQLRVDALAAAFRDTERGSGYRNSLQLIGEPQYVGSDTRSQLMLAVAFGVLVGLLLGTALATVRENWPVLTDLRRRARRPGQ